MDLMVMMTAKVTVVMRLDKDAKRNELMDVMRVIGNTARWTATMDADRRDTSAVDRTVSSSTSLKMNLTAGPTRSPTKML